MSSKIKDMFGKLKTPGIIFSVVYSLISFIIIASTIVLLVLGYSNFWLTYVLYGLSALTFSYLVYIFIFYIPKIRDSIIKHMKKHKFTNEMLNSYGYRSFVFASISFVINVLYAVFQAVFAILSKSIWFGALATYYIIISLIRGGIIVVARKRKVQKDNFTIQKQLKAYRNCGIYLVVLNFALVAAIIQMVRDGGGFEYAGLMIYVMATYTFYKLGMSIYNIFKARSHNDYTIQSIRNISFADSLVSILALQTALLAAFADNYKPMLPNALTGGAVSLVIIAIGIYMIVSGQRQLLKLQKENING